MRGASRAVTLTALLAMSAQSGAGAVDHRYCVIGAGPGAVQMGHYMLRAGMDYHIFERNGAAVCRSLPLPQRRLRHGSTRTSN